MEFIKVKTCDNKEFSVEKEVLFLSVLIKNMFQDLEVGDEAVPLPSVNGHVFEKGN
jgi:hypothetical protein